MKIYNYHLSRNIFSLNRYTKKSLAILTDILLCVLCLWFAIYLRTEEFIYFKDYHECTLHGYEYSTELVTNFSKEFEKYG